MATPKRYISCSGKRKLPSFGDYAQPEQPFDKIWKKHSALIISWFTKALSRGTPRPTDSEPLGIDSLNCACKKKQAKVIVYMTHDGISKFQPGFKYNSDLFHIVCEINVERCQCRGLFETLILRQVFPSSPKSPKKGCHFAFLDFVRHWFKPLKVSSATITQITNDHSFGKNNGVILKLGCFIYQHVWR